MAREFGVTSHWFAIVALPGFGTEPQPKIEVVLKLVGSDAQSRLSKFPKYRIVWHNRVLVGSPLRGRKTSANRPPTGRRAVNRGRSVRTRLDRTRETEFRAANSGRTWWPLDRFANSDFHAHGGGDSSRLRTAASNDCRRQNRPETTPWIARKSFPSPRWFRNGATERH